MMVEKRNEPTPKQRNIFDYIGQRCLSGIVKVHVIYDDYAETSKCSRDYFIDVLSTRWSVFKEDGTLWVDFDSPVGDVWTLESFSQPS